MIIEIDLDLMKAYSLSLDEYALLLLLNKTQYERIREYFVEEDKLYSLLDSLVKHKFIVLKLHGFRDCLPDYKILFVPHYLRSEFDSWFEKLVDAYPKIVKRPNGEEDNLTVNLPKSKELYKRITKGNKSNHEHILECLRYQLKFLQKRANGLMYMKRLYKWLEEQGWKDYEDAMLKSKELYKNNPHLATTNEEVAYGHRII